jgi:hypothetical protein
MLKILVNYLQNYVQPKRQWHLNLMLVVNVVAVFPRCWGRRNVGVQQVADESDTGRAQDPQCYGMRVALVLCSNVVSCTLSTVLRTGRTKTHQPGCAWCTQLQYDVTVLPTCLPCRPWKKFKTRMNLFTAQNWFMGSWRELLRN